MKPGRALLSVGTILSAGIAVVPASAAPNDPGRDKVATQIHANHDQSVQRLRDWIKLPTIANMGINHKEGAEYMRQNTLAIYFMYDVKHYDPAEWSSPPLEGKIVDREGEGRALIGRGAVNQKGPETAFLAAVRAFKTAGVKLPVNLVLVAEGEEEIASPHFKQIVTQPDVRAALDKAVGVIIPSSGQSLEGASTLSLGAKGVV